MLSLPALSHAATAQLPLSYPPLAYAFPSQSFAFPALFPLPTLVSLFHETTVIKAIIFAAQRLSFLMELKVPVLVVTDQVTLA